VVLIYGNNSPNVARKYCNILILVVTDSYHNGQNPCGEKQLQQYNRFVVKGLFQQRWISWSNFAQCSLLLHMGQTKHFSLLYFGQDLFAVYFILGQHIFMVDFLFGPLLFALNFILGFSLFCSLLFVKPSTIKLYIIFGTRPFQQISPTCQIPNSHVWKYIQKTTISDGTEQTEHTWNSSNRSKTSLLQCVECLQPDMLTTIASTNYKYICPFPFSGFRLQISLTRTFKNIQTRSSCKRENTIINKNGHSFYTSITAARSVFYFSLVG
jgi:hypothetical protein